MTRHLLSRLRPRRRLPEQPRLRDRLVTVEFTEEHTGPRRRQTYVTDQSPAELLGMEPGVVILWTQELTYEELQALRAHGEVTTLGVVL